MAGNNIDQLLAEGNLAEAFNQYADFLQKCEQERQALAQNQGRYAFVENQVNAALIGNEANIERNRIRLSFQNQLDIFRQNVLAAYFDIANKKAIFEGFDNRDKIIHEILDLRLRPKRYLRQDQLVEGGSSIVYRIQNVDTQRHAVAMVLKTPELSDEAKQEIKQLTDLRHRNVIKLLDHELNSYPYFIITEYVHGPTLPQAIEKTGPRPVAQAVDWLYQLAEALDYLRHKRILHTNMRPSKVFIDDEWQIMISPFDLHRVTTGEQSFNRYIDLCRYGSPELHRNDGKSLSLDEMCASDQYSLGLLAFKIMTSEDLYQGSTVYEILESRKKFNKPDYRRAQFKRLPKDSFDLKINASKSLVGIIQQLLQEDPKDRFQDLHQLLRALHPFTRADLPKTSLARQSYRRCLAVNKNLIHDFYAKFRQQLPHVATHFTLLGQQRQSAMLQMAVDVLLDLDTKSAFLFELASNRAHEGYTESDFALFLDVLIETLANNDRFWSEEIAAEWQIIRENALNILKTRIPPL